MSGIRMHFKHTIHFITNRCEQEQFLLLPSTRVNQLIGAWFARSLALFGQGLEIYAFIFLGNHFHLLCKDTEGRLAQFMGYFQGNLARAINQELGRHGKFFAREYDDAILDGDEAFLNRYAYILCNAVKAGLVEKATDWPGWSSLDGALSDGKYRFELLNATQYYKAMRFGKPTNASDYIETWEFEMATPPMLQHLSKEERTKQIQTLVSDAEEKYRLQREGQPVLGVEAIQRQQPTDRPQNPARKPRIKFICFNQKRLCELLEGYREFTRGYRNALNIFYKSFASNKKANVEWPHGSYPPSYIKTIDYPLAA